MLHKQSDTKKGLKRRKYFVPSFSKKMSQVRDYSDVPRFTGSLSNSSFPTDEKVLEGVVKDFWENGFAGPVKILTDQDCDDLLKDLTTFQNGGLIF